MALLGTGVMGAGMAANIARAGIDLTVWNRDRRKAEPLAEHGARVASSPAEAVDGADVVVTMLWDAGTVVEVLDAVGAYGSGAVLLQTTTVGVDGAARVGEAAARHGLTYLDAPVLGTKKPAEDGALVVLASGPSSVRPQVDAVLDAVSSRVMWVSEEAGAGSRLKLVANAWVATVVDGIAECLRLAEGLGLDPALFLEAVKGGAMDAPYVGLKGRSMLAGDFTPAFSLSGAAKDTGLVVEAARAAGLDLALLETVQAHFSAAEASGHGSKDLSAVYLSH